MSNVSDVFHGDVEFSNHLVQCALKEKTCDVWLYIAEKMQRERHKKNSQGVGRRSFATGQGFGQTWLNKSEKFRWHGNRIKRNSSQWHWLGLRQRRRVSQDPGDILDLETTYVDKDDKIAGVVKDSRSDPLEGRVFRNRTTPISPGKLSFSLDTKESRQPSPHRQTLLAHL